MFEIPEWPCFLGAPGASGLIRSSPEDFQVEEIPRVLPQGEGSHLWLWVEKRSANTDWVARELARVLQCSHRDVGYAGLKDRHALTRQWFSVPHTDTTRENLQAGVLQINDIEGVRLLEYQSHNRKLKRGTLDGNRFRLKIRSFAGNPIDLQHRLEQIQARGVPNYFGPQRFGHDGRNVRQGYSLLKSGKRLARNKRSIYLSAIRSYMFNQVLAQRVRLGNWDRIIDGDLAMLDGSQSIFPCEMPDTEIEDRCSRHDIHPTGPLPGEAGTQPTALAAKLEMEVLQGSPELVDLLVSKRVKASRRALRLYPAELEWSLQEDMFDLAFVLPAGTYATTVLRELLVYSAAN